TAIAKASLGGAIATGRSVVVSATVFGIVEQVTSIAGSFTNSGAITSTVKADGLAKASAIGVTAADANAITTRVVGNAFGLSIISTTIGGSFANPGAIGAHATTLVKASALASAPSGAATALASNHTVLARASGMIVEPAIGGSFSNSGA